MAGPAVADCGDFPCLCGQLVRLHTMGELMECEALPRCKYHGAEDMHPWVKQPLFPGDNPPGPDMGWFCGVCRAADEMRKGGL